VRWVALLEFFDIDRWLPTIDALFDIEIHQARQHRILSFNLCATDHVARVKDADVDVHSHGQLFRLSSCAA
jgi:hypothetical protein